MKTWADIKYFKPEEFDSPDEKGSGLTHMSLDLVSLLDELRIRIARPIFINSGYRTYAHHKQIYSKHTYIPDSAHLRGLAVDIRTLDSQMRFSLVKEAYILGFTRIEVAPAHTHLDIDKTLPQNVLIHLANY